MLRTRRFGHIWRSQACGSWRGAANLFDRYVHGEIQRREFFDGAKKFATGGVTAMALWESLRPNYALAQQVAKDDKRIKTEYTTVPSPQGNGKMVSRRWVDTQAMRRRPRLLLEPSTGRR